MSNQGNASWWWISFCDTTRPEGSQLLGCAVIDGGPNARTVLSALHSLNLGIDLKCEMMCFPIPNDMIHLYPDDCRSKLLSKEQAQSLAAVVDSLSLN